MTQTLSVNANNDIYLNKDGNISISRDIDAVLQACQQAAQTILGEMVLQVDQGIPYFETVWSGIPNLQQWTSALRSAWLNVANVVQVESLVTSQQDDKLIYSAIIRTTFGAGGITNG